MVNAAGWLGQLQEDSFSKASPTLRKAYPPERRMSGPQLERYLERQVYALASSTRPDGRPHAAPTLFSVHAESFWLPTLGRAVRLRNVRAQPWLALSVVEGDHETHAAMLTEGPVEIVSAAPDSVQEITTIRNAGGSLDWAEAWLQLKPQRLFSFAEVDWVE